MFFCFVYFKVYSDFLMINGLVKVKLLVKNVVVDNMVVMVFIDFSNFCGLVKFYGEVFSLGLKLIIGVDIFVCVILEIEELDEFILFVKNNKGYYNIMMFFFKVY